MAKNVETIESSYGVSSREEQDTEFDFLEQPNPDFFCPVAMELLVEPLQTTCCGNHLSLAVVNRIFKEGKPCPLCMNETFALNDDKYFKRKVKELKVHCSHKKCGCEWIGELGDLNHHTTSCPKRPWKCQYCDFESTHDIGTNDHTPCCDNYPLPCPNQCEIGTVPRCQADSHLLECPLQLVECEFAGTGCNVKVPRRDLAGHMTENAQHHLMTATLLNLRLTRELHQKMEEKDKQISSIQEHVIKLDSQLQHSETLLLKTSNKIHGIEQHLAKLDTKLSGQLTRLHCQVEDTVRLNGFTYDSFNLTDFKKQQAKGVTGCWLSEPFYSFPLGYVFKLGIDTNGCREGAGTHLSACLWLGPGEHDKELKWPIKCDVHLLMLNQRRDHGHHRVMGTVVYSRPSVIYEHKVIGASYKFFPTSKLGYDSDTDTTYLFNDILRFRMYLRVRS